MKITHLTLSVAIACTLGACGVQQNMPDKAPIDYVDPYIGNISHLLVPTFQPFSYLTVCCEFIPNAQTIHPNY